MNIDYSSLFPSHELGETIAWQVLDRLPPKGRANIARCNRAWRDCVAYIEACSVNRADRILDARLPQVVQTLSTAFRQQIPEAQIEAKAEEFVGGCREQLQLDFVRTFSYHQLSALEEYFKNKLSTRLFTCLQAGSATVMKEGAGQLMEIVASGRPSGDALSEPKTAVEFLARQHLIDCVYLVIEGTLDQFNYLTARGPDYARTLMTTIETLIQPWFEEELLLCFDRIGAASLESALLETFSEEELEELRELVEPESYGSVRNGSLMCMRRVQSAVVKWMTDVLLPV